MRGWCGMVGTIALGVALAGCSFQGTLDGMVSRERQGEIISVARNLCDDPAAVTRQLHPEIVNTVREVESRLPAECPGEKATWELASYQWNSNITNGLKQQQEEAVVVGTGAGKWSTVSLRFYGENGASPKIVKWTLEASREKPSALVFVENFDRTARTMRIAVPAGLLLVGVLVGWLIRRRRRRAA